MQSISGFGGPYHYDHKYCQQVKYSLRHDMNTDHNDLTRRMDLQFIGRPYATLKPSTSRTKANMAIMFEARECGTVQLFRILLNPLIEGRFIKRRPLFASLSDRGLRVLSPTNGGLLVII